MCEITDMLNLKFEKRRSCRVTLDLKVWSELFSLSFFKVTSFNTPEITWSWFTAQIFCCRTESSLRASAFTEKQEDKQLPAVLQDSCGLSLILNTERIQKSWNNLDPQVSSQSGFVPPVIAWGSFISSAATDH